MTNDALGSKANPSLMRAINAATVVQTLRQRGPMSRADLGGIIGLSKPTISNVVSYLEQSEYVEAVAGADREPSGVARRRELYRFRASRGNVLGIDIGADKLLMILADLDGAVVARRHTSLRQTAKRGPDAVLGRIKTIADELFREAGVPVERLWSVVAGTPGVVSPEGVVTLAPQLPEWEGFDLKGALESRFPCAVHVEREVTLSLLAERWAGVAQGVDDALFINLGVGIGAAILTGGQITRGFNGGAGEIGAMPLVAAAPSDNRSFGPFELAAGGIAFADRGRRAALEPGGRAILDLAGGDAEAVDAAVVFEAARRGDEVARTIVDQAVSTLAWGIACLVCALNPSTVILGGGLSRSADLLLDPVQRAVNGSVPFPPRWLVSEMGQEAVALGALRRATETLEHDLFLSPAALATP